MAFMGNESGFTKDDVVVHAEWIPVDDTNDAFDCSECDAMVRQRYNFCTKCGMKARNAEVKR